MELVGLDLNLKDGKGIYIEEKKKRVFRVDKLTRTHGGG